jgi:hypothetical protein
MQLAACRPSFPTGGYFADHSAGARRYGALRGDRGQCEAFASAPPIIRWCW